MRAIIIILALASVATITSCSSQKSQLKEFMMCGIAAESLGQSQASEAISIKLAKYLADHNIAGGPREAMEIADEVRNEDLALYRYSSREKVKVLLEVFNSGDCQDLHGQPELGP